jgi:hypothetical protein
MKRKAPAALGEAEVGFGRFVALRSTSPTSYRIYEEVRCISA